VRNGLDADAGARAERALRTELTEASTDGERIAALEAWAGPIVAVDLAHRLVPFAATLEDLDLDGHPWAGLLAGVAICSIDHGRGMAILHQALGELEAAEDDDGVGYACLMLGNEELAKGNIAVANQLWLRARELLGPENPADLIAAAHSALAAYQGGDLMGAIAQAEAALLKARIADNAHAEGIACVYLAFFSWWTGDFAGVGHAARDAEAALGRIPDENNRYELPLVAAARGAVAGLRGHHAELEAEFLQGLREARGMHNDWYEAILLTMRAELASPWDPPRSVDDAQRALRYFRETGESWWSNWALQALAIAQRESGQDQASSAAVDRLLADTLNPLERGRALLIRGDTLARAGELPAATIAYAEALAALEPLGAHFWTARAETGLAATDSRRAAYWHRAAIRRAGAHINDPAWQRNLRGEATFRVEILGTPRVIVNGTPVRFPTVAALNAVARLAIAHPSGVHAETLAEDLWPGCSPDRTTHRLDNLLSQIRNTIRPASRLRRNGGLIQLSLDVDECDYLAASARAREILRDPTAPTDLAEVEQLRELLGRPLAGGGYADWTLETQSQMDTLQARLAARDV
jgi:tetratricopeptide (TPR) repeat protein